MKIRTSTLMPPALNWVVAKCEPDDTLGIYFDDQTGEALVHDDWPDFQQYNPSTDWAQGGPIIEREGMQLQLEDIAEWHATMWWDDEDGQREIVTRGPTPLIAAMRCYVASKLGDEVEIPMELLK